MFNKDLCNELIVLTGGDTESWSDEAAAYHMINIMCVGDSITNGQLESLYVNTVTESVDTLKNDVSNVDATFSLLYAVGSDLFRRILDAVRSGTHTVTIQPIRISGHLTFRVEFGKDDFVIAV